MANDGVQNRMTTSIGKLSAIEDVCCFSFIYYSQRSFKKVINFFQFLLGSCAYTQYCCRNSFSARRWGTWRRKYCKIIARLFWDFGGVMHIEVWFLLTISQRVYEGLMEVSYLVGRQTPHNRSVYGVHKDAILEDLKLSWIQKYSDEFSCTKWWNTGPRRLHGYRQVSSPLKKLNV